MFKRADLGKYLGRENVEHNFTDFPLHYTRPRLDLEEGVSNSPLGRAKNPYDIFINLDGSKEMAVQSKKLKPIALVKWLTKKVVEKIHEEHQQLIMGRENQMQVLEFTNEEHNQEFSRLNEEINDLISNRFVARSGCFDNALCFIKKEQQRRLPILCYSMSI